VTSNPPTAIQTLIDDHINGFNTHDNDLFLGVFGDTAIIIDGIAPYRWLNPNAPATWLADVAKWRTDLGVTKEHLSYEMGFWNVEGSSAYAVISGTLTVTIKGQSVVRRLEDRGAGLGPHVVRKSLRSAGVLQDLDSYVCLRGGHFVG
jgi:hypothetical protein